MLKSIWDDIRNQFKQGENTVQLIIICVAVFILTQSVYLVCWSMQNLEAWQWFFTKISFPFQISKLFYQPWSVLTWMFVHNGVSHIFFNMLWLYSFGQIYELYMPNRRFWELFIVGSLMGALVAVLFSYLLPPLRIYISAGQMVGASAGIEAIVFAATALNPNHRIRLFGFFEIEIKYIAIFSFLMSFVDIAGNNPGGMLAHIGGAIFGYSFILLLRNGTDIFDIFSLFKKPKMVVTHRKENAPNIKSNTSSSTQKQVDDILDKINKSGYESLSATEKDFLFKYSKE